MALAKPGIREQAELVLRLPPEQRGRFLLEAPKPMALVRALPDADFYLTVREIGPQGALPILALASASQISHLLDLESWRRDRFDAVRCGAWVALLVEAGEPTLRRFVRSVDDETLILLFRLWAHVRPLDIDHEEPTRGHGVGDVGDERGFLAPDGANLFSPERSEHAIAARRLAEILYLDDRDRYFGLIRSALFELPSEVEEVALHWRTSRLEEHGYPALDEALTIYAPPEATPQPPAPAPEPGEALAAPRAALRAMGADALISRAVDRLSDADRERVLLSLMAVANRVLVADGGDAGSLEAQRAAVERAAAYVTCALTARGAGDEAAAGEALATVAPYELFREGYALAAGLSTRARAMLGSGWGSRHPRALDLVDPPLRGRVASLLPQRPRYVPLAQGEDTSRDRDFRSIAEVEETRLTLELLEALGASLLGRRGIPSASILDEERRPLEGMPTFSTLLLTALAWHATRGEIRIDRLPAEIVADFLRTTASRRTADPEAPARAMARLIDALAAESDWPRRTAAALAAFGAGCLTTLAADCANLDPGTPVTPRVVGCLRLA
jgi:hypothetical protein